MCLTKDFKMVSGWSLENGIYLHVFTEVMKPLRGVNTKKTGEAKPMAGHNLPPPPN